MKAEPVVRQLVTDEHGDTVEITYGGLPRRMRTSRTAAVFIRLYRYRKTRHRFGMMTRIVTCRPFDKDDVPLI